MTRSPYRLPPVECQPGAHAVLARVIRGLLWVRIGRVANDDDAGPRAA